MQFAFGTSVAGVSCSICFNIINRILQGSSYRAIDDFVSNFTSLAMSRPLDNDVQLICQNQDSNHMLSTLTDTLPGQLAGAMEHSVRSAMQPVSQAMDNFLMGATRAQVDGVGRIVGSFVQQMNASLSDQLLTPWPHDDRGESASAGVAGASPPVAERRCRHSGGYAPAA